MERRKALAAATAATLVLGSGIVGAVSLSGMSVLGFGGGSSHRVSVSADARPAAVSQRVVVRRRDVYDRRVVDTTTTPAADLQSSIDTSDITPSTPAATTSPSEPISAPSTTTAPVPVGSPHSTSPTTDDDAGPPATSPTTQSSTTPTTLPPTTPTTRPRGVPSNWPPGVPIPPEPANCREARLSLSGIWHCDD